MMDSNDEKALYENLDVIASEVRGGSDIVGAVLGTMLGLEVENGMVVLDPRTRDRATFVARRWMISRGYLPPVSPRPRRAQCQECVSIGRACAIHRREPYVGPRTN